MRHAAPKALCSRISCCQAVVFASALGLAPEIGREAQEGRRIGTLFTAGKADAVLAVPSTHSRPVDRPCSTTDAHQSRPPRHDPRTRSFYGAFVISETMIVVVGEPSKLNVWGVVLQANVNRARVGGAKRKKEECMSTQWMQIAAVAAVVTIGAPALGVAQSSQTQGDTFTWSGELVSFDAIAKSMTVKSRVAYQEAISELTHFKAGDHVWVVWSGNHDYSDAVRQVRRADTGRTIDDPLVLPAELVSTEAPNQYITIRVKLPESALAAITTVKPGQWITVTSRHRPSTDADAVVAVRPYATSTLTD